MADVAVSQYRAFVGAADCYGTVRAEVAEIESKLDAMRGALPALRRGCQEFAARAEQISHARSLNRRTLSHHATILDLLEVPQLQDTCIRHGNFDEALDLESFVGKMTVSYATDVPVIRALGDGVKESSDVMLTQLLSRLEGAIQLPECLRIVGYLRRMAVLDEVGLRRTFLRCRETFVAGAVRDLDTHSSYDYLKRLTDLHRVHLFDVVMQYRAIFADDSCMSDDAAAIGAGEAGAGWGSGDGGLLYSWSTYRVSAYLHALETALPRIEEGGALASVMEHCQYCGTSLARVGLDFRAMLSPLFAAAAANIFARALECAAADFERVVEQHRWTATTSSASLAAAAENKNTHVEGDSASTGGALAPPYALLEHVPVAALTNGVLAAFNDLRHCALPALRAPLAKQLRSCVARAAAALIRVDATHHDLIEGSGQRAAFVGACKACEL
jgi:hypothetical protein